MTKRDVNDLTRIVNKINFNEEDITFYLLFSMIINHYPDTDIQELDMIEELNDFKDALFKVLEYVRNRDRFNKRIMRIVE